MLQEKFTFCNSPVNVREPRQTACLLHFATRYARKLPVNLEINVPERIPSGADELQQMEGLHQATLLALLSLPFECIRYCLHCSNLQLAISSLEACQLCESSATCFMYSSMSKIHCPARYLCLTYCTLDVKKVIFFQPCRLYHCGCGFP